MTAARRYAHAGSHTHRRAHQGLRGRLLAQAARTARSTACRSRSTPGEVFGFLGPNGAGKTTTLKLLMQLIFPTSGRAEILGRPVGDVADAAAHRLPAREPVLLRLPDRRGAARRTSRGCSATRGATARTRVRGAARRVGIGAERRLQLRKFSKGMMQRVGIAQALLNDPEVVFLDEPMSGLDPLGRRDVRALILELRDQRLHGVLQLARPRRCRGAVQPRRDRRRRPARGVRPADRHAGVQVRGWELVVADLQPEVLARARARASARVDRDLAGTLHARAAARSAAGAAARRADRRRRARWSR